MTLPTTGQLSINDIQIELGRSSGAADASLRGLANLAGFAAGDVSIGRFYGYSHGAIDAYYGSTTYNPSPTTTYLNGYRTIVRDTQTSSQTISLTIGYTLISTSGGDANIYWSRNSTSSWTYVTSAYYSTTSGTFTITNISSTDVIRIRLELNLFDGYGYLNGVASINSGTVTSGTGTVTPVVPFNWSETVSN